MRDLAWRHECERRVWVLGQHIEHVGRRRIGQVGVQGEYVPAPVAPADLDRRAVVGELLIEGVRPAGSKRTGAVVGRVVPAREVDQKDPAGEAEVARRRREHSGREVHRIGRVRTIGVLAVGILARLSKVVRVMLRRGRRAGAEIVPRPVAGVPIRERGPGRRGDRRRVDASRCISSWYDAHAVDRDSELFCTLERTVPAPPAADRSRLGGRYALVPDPPAALTGGSVATPHAGIRVGDVARGGPHLYPGAGHGAAEVPVAVRRRPDHRYLFDEDAMAAEVGPRVVDRGGRCRVDVVLGGPVVPGLAPQDRIRAGPLIALVHLAVSVGRVRVPVGCAPDGREGRRRRAIREIERLRRRTDRIVGARRHFADQRQGDNESDHERPRDARSHCAERSDVRRAHRERAR